MQVIRRPSTAEAGKDITKDMTARSDTVAALGMVQIVGVMAEASVVGPDGAKEKTMYRHGTRKMKNGTRMAHGNGNMLKNHGAGNRRKDHGPVNRRPHPRLMVDTRRTQAQLDVPVRVMVHLNNQAAEAEEDVRRRDEGQHLLAQIQKKNPIKLVSAILNLLSL